MFSKLLLLGILCYCYQVVNGISHEVNDEPILKVIDRGHLFAGDAIELSIINMRITDNPQMKHPLMVINITRDKPLRHLFDPITYDYLVLDLYAAVNNCDFILDTGMNSTTNITQQPIIISTMSTRSMENEIRSGLSGELQEKFDKYVLLKKAQIEFEAEETRKAKEEAKKANEDAAQKIIIADRFKSENKSLKDAKEVLLHKDQSDVLHKDVENEFGAHGTVNKVEVKHKRDPLTNNIMSTFACVTISITDSLLNQCLQEFKNEKFRGRFLTVSVARENFMDKLKREREESTQSPSNSTSVNLFPTASVFTVSIITLSLLLFKVIARVL